MELPRESSIMHAESLNDSNRHNMRSLLHNFPFHREALFIVNNLLIKKLKSLQVELESRIYMWTSQRVASRGSFRKRPTSHTLKKSRQPEWVVINYASLNCLTSDYRKWTERAKLNWTVGYGRLDMSASNWKLNVDAIMWKSTWIIRKLDWDLIGTFIIADGDLKIIEMKWFTVSTILRWFEIP